MLYCMEALHRRRTYAQCRSHKKDRPEERPKSREETPDKGSDIETSRELI